jgi:hypothetical protein
VVVALLLLLFAARIALPLIAKDLLEDIASDALRVEFVVGEVSFDLLEGEVVVEEVAMRGVAAEDDLARAASIAVDVDWAALIMGELRAERIAIQGPEFFFEIDESGLLNWDAVGGPNAEPSEASPAPADSPEFRVACERVEIGAGTFEFVDGRQEALPDLAVSVGTFQLQGAEVAREAPGAPLRWALQGAKAEVWRLGVTPIGREALDFEVEANAGPAAADGTIPLDLSMLRKDGVELSLKGSIHPVPFALELALEWKGLSSRAVAPLLLTGADVERGSAQGALVLRLDLDDVPERGLKLTGNVQHDGLALHVDDDPSVDVVIERFIGEIEEIWFPIPLEVPEAPQPVRIAWKRIDLQKVVIDVWPGGGGNAAGKPIATVAVLDAAHERSLEESAPSDEPAESAALEPVVASEEVSQPDPRADAGTMRPAADVAAIEPEQPVEPSPPSLDVAIAAFSLSEGRLVWHDPNLGEHSEQVLSGIRMDASALHWPATTAENVKLTIESLGAKPFRIEGPIRAGGAELAIRGSGIKLVPWNPLISHYSDYSIRGGSLSIQSDFELVADTYESPTRVTVHRIQATTDGTGFQKTFGVPLSAATTLLSDPAGNIDLKIPVSGKLGSEGELQLGLSLVDAVREGIMNALTSLIASPFALAGSALVSGHEFAFLRIGEAVFEPGSEELGPAAIEELDRAAEFVAKSPDAKLELVAEIVASDLDVSAEKGKRPNVFRSMVAGGAALFKGRRTLDSNSYLLALDLAKGRMKSAAEHLAATGVLGPERVVQAEWDESVAGGSPRIVLRIDLSPDEED